MLALIQSQAILFTSFLYSIFIYVCVYDINKQKMEFQGLQ